MPIEIERGGFRRWARVFASEAWKDELSFGPRPILLVLHDEDVQATTDDLEDVAQIGALVTTERGQDVTTAGRFVVVLPEGIRNRVTRDYEDEERPSSGGSWNSGHRGRDTKSLDVHDVQYIEELIFELCTRFQAELDGQVFPPDDPATWALDPTNVFVAGGGNGGEMAYRLASNLSQEAVDAGREYAVVVRGIAVVCGSNDGRTDPAPRFPRRGPWLPPVTVTYESGAVAVVPTARLIAFAGELDDDFVEGPLAVATPSVAKRALLDWMAPADADAHTPESASALVAYEDWAVNSPELGVPYASSIAVLASPPDWVWRSFTNPAGVAPFFVPFEVQHFAMIGLGHGWPAVDDAAGIDVAVQIWDFFASLVV